MVCSLLSEIVNDTFGLTLCYVTGRHTVTPCGSCSTGAKGSGNNNASAKRLRIGHHTEKHVHLGPDTDRAWPGPQCNLCGFDSATTDRSNLHCANRRSSATASSAILEVLIGEPQDRHLTPESVPEHPMDLKLHLPS